MQNLDIIKWAILIMVVLNVLAIAGTAGMRVWRNHTNRRIEERIETFKPALHEFLDTGEISSELEEPDEQDLDILSALICEVITELPEDSERRRLMRLAGKLGLVSRDLDRLRSDKAQERARAAENLGFYGGPDIVEDVSRLLSDEHETPRALAARALSRVGTAEAAQSLADHLDAPSELTRLRIISSLETMKQVAVEPLIELLKDPEKPPRARVLAIKVLGNIEVAEARCSLRQAARHEDLDLSAQAVQALGKIGNSEDLDVVLEAAEDDRWPLRAQAASALGTIGNDSAIPTLKELMTDSEWWVRSNAGNALTRMGRKGERGLVEMLDSPDDYARERAAASLENGGAVRRAVDQLTESGEQEEWARTLLRRITTTEVSKHLQYLTETLPDDEKRQALEDAISEGHES